MRKLPSGWAIAPLRVIAEINPRHPKALKNEMLVTFVPMAALSESKPEFQYSEEHPLGEVRKGFTHFAEDDVLFAKITPCMENGKGAVARRLRNNLGCGTTELHVIRPLAGISPDYIYRFLAQRSVRRTAKEHFTGTAGQARVPTTFIEEIEIPVPPSEEQKRITEKVEAVTAKIDASKEKLGRIAPLLKRFRQAILAAACSGRLTADWREERHQDDEWPMTTLQAVVRSLDQGWSPQCDLQPSPSPEIWGVIKTTAVQAMKFLEEENKKLPDVLSPRENLELRAGDLLITRAGPRARAGVCCLVRSVRARLMACDKVYRFRVNESLAKAEFVELALNTLQKVQELDTLKTGISDSGVNLTQEKFLALEFPLPPLPEQQEIVRRVKSLFLLADRIEARFLEARKRVDSITQAILAKAFRGELVPTEAELAKAEGRSFESAEELLERIRQNGDPREKLQKPPQTSRSKETLLKKNRHLQKAFRGEL